MKKYLLILTLLLFSGGLFSQTAPTLYYRFENSLSPTIGSGAIAPTSGSTYQFGANGPVGSYLNLDALSSGTVTGGTVNTTNGLTVQFLFKAGRNYARTRNNVVFAISGAQISFQYPRIFFTTDPASGASYEMAVALDKPGVLSWDYLFDNNWHHLAFVRSTTGDIKIFIDGQNPSQLRATTTAGNLTAGGAFALGSGTSYVRNHNYIDEVAIYGTALDSLQIYQNYTEFLNGDPYTTANAGAVPAYETITLELDTMEFVSGTVLPTVGNNTDCSTCPSPLAQLQKFPAPRYRYAFREDTRRLFNWGGMDYLGDRGSLAENSTSVARAVAVNYNLATKWNYYLTAATNVSADTDYSTNPTARFASAFAKQANDNPTIPASAITFRIQTPTGGSQPMLQRTNLAATNYFQDGSGNFLDINGNVTGVQNNKVWRPIANSADYIADGDEVRTRMQSLINAMPNRPTNRKLDLINENGEIYPLISAGLLDKDPEVKTARLSLNLNPQAFIGRKIKEFENTSYRNRFMSMPGLANTKYTYYAMQGKVNQSGTTDFGWDWAETRDMNSTMVNGQYFSTPDFYVRWPSNWKDWQSAWHGLRWAQESRTTELSMGDSLFSPFVAAGWSNSEEENVRPGQWLGFLKTLVMYGADFFYTGYFNINSPQTNPRNWVWQMAMPAYAQATMTHIGGFLKHGKLMTSDVPVSYVEQYNGFGRPSYLQYSGHPHKLVLTRQVKQESTGQMIDRYAIMGTIQPYSNYANSTPSVDTVTIALAGQNLTFEIRRQGSTYIYDKTDAANPVFYQVDKWHESSHPSRWDREFWIEAECTDNGITNKVIKTDNTVNNLNGDYTSYTTHARPASSTGSLIYYFHPVDTNATYYVWVRVKKTSTSNPTLKININGQNSKGVSITDTNFQWYSVARNGTRLAYTNLNANRDHRLRIYGTTDVAIDQIYITPDINATP